LFRRVTSQGVRRGIDQARCTPRMRFELALLQPRPRGRVQRRLDPAGGSLKRAGYLTLAPPGRRCGLRAVLTHMSQRLRDQGAVVALTITANQEPRRDRPQTYRMAQPSWLDQGLDILWTFD